MAIDTEFALSAPQQIVSAQEYGEDEQEAKRWEGRGTAAGALKSAHIYGLMAESGHKWTPDPHQARLDSSKDRSQETRLLREAAGLAERAGWPVEVADHLRAIADSAPESSIGDPATPPRSGDRPPAGGNLRVVAQREEAAHPWERLTTRTATALHLARDYEHHEIKTARDHRHALLQARAVGQSDFDSAMRAARIFEHMADSGHKWERNEDLAKAKVKDDQREEGYCLFAAAGHAAAAGRPDGEVKRLYTRAYGVLTAAGEPEPDLRVWLWPDGGEDARYNLALARCYLQLGRSDEAERRTERAIWQKLIDAPYLSNHDRAVVENMGTRLLRDEGISGIDC